MSMTSSLTARNFHSSTPVLASTPFLLADIGEGISEVELLQWFVAPGDKIRQFDRVCEVQSDKATVEITSRYDGTITSIEGSVGDMMKVGAPLCHIEMEGGGGADTVQEEVVNSVDDKADRLSVPPSSPPDLELTTKRSRAAGDICDELFADACLERMSGILDSMQVDDEQDVLTKVREHYLLA